MNEPTYWVYILHCQGNRYYTGFTNNLEKRYQAHVSGMARCKFTRSFKPLFIAQCWEISGNKSLALKMERYIKSLSRLEKEKLISSPELLRDKM